MKRWSLLAAALIAVAAHAAPAETFRAPRIVPELALDLGPAVEKAYEAPTLEGRPQRVATVRPSPAPHRLVRWIAVEDGYIARFVARAEGAHGLRVRLDLGPVPGPMEVRAAGDDGRVFTMPLDPRVATQSWTPWTDGESQVVEVFSRVRPSPEALTVGALLHFDAPRTTKAAATCTVSTHCTSGNPVLDAAITEAKRSVMRMSFVDGSSGYVCSATLVNSPRNPLGHVLTAHHCISNNTVAATISARFFFETVDCTNTISNGLFQQVAGGMQVVFTNFHVDASLLLMNNPPPAGAVYATINPARIAPDVAVVSLSHPTGDTARFALGTMTAEYRPSTTVTGAYPQDMYGVRWSRGTTEGGSSGSGLFTLSPGGQLEIRGTLFGGTITEVCDPNKRAGYGRLDIFHSQIEPYLRLGTAPADDVPNRVLDYATIPLDPVADLPLDSRGSPLTHANKVLTVGDVDVFRFTLATPKVVRISSQGTNDLIGSILTADGGGVRANDDAQTGNLNFGLTELLQPGVHYLQVASWDPTQGSNYSVTLETYDVGQNYTDIWWNAAESGWGVNVNHQGNTLFATLFTYDTDGTPMWLVMSGGVKQNDLSYVGELFRTTGPAFNAPWAPSAVTPVGTMRFRFTNSFEGVLTYTVNGVTVAKEITRQTFGKAPKCEWSGFDRSFSFNVTDLWYNAAEPGWGINIAQKGTVFFATIFTYAPGGKGAWFVMSNGSVQTDDTVSGDLFRTTGPAFNASPWTPITATKVGTLKMDFTDGAKGSLNYTVDGISVTKAIQRQDFSQPRTECR